MKLVGIAGSTEDHSYNRTLLKFMASHYGEEADIELLDINDVPMFNQSDDQTDSDAVQYLNRKILAADGVIIATPEHNHTLTASLKSVIEWLSFNIHPFNDKPVMIVGASYYDQGSSRAQLMLRQILESPGVNAIVMPGNEFLLANVKDAFDENNNLKDARTVDFLGSTLQKFVKFVKVINTLNEPTTAEEEDLSASGKIDTTVEGVDMNADDWVEQAAAKTHAAEGDDYIKLDRGLLTVNQLNMFLNTMPMELTYADSNNQFIYYNKMLPTEKMLAPRRPGQTGDPMSSVHPGRAVKHVKQVINALRTGKTDLVKMPVPGNTPDRFIMHYYKAMRDADNQYKGINEWVLDLAPIVKYYLEATGQQLVADPNAKVDATSGASAKGAEKPDATASASVEEAKPEETATDATTSASVDEADTPATPAAPVAPAEPEPAAEVDGTSGASES
ncbi:NADPH-dependent oxidoreductase [Furfurilactobacillus siliginis]|uniref:FMN reductase n=1 Tax=Furfurilactobacillus siliginis TaxID=348151 RepID=A0A0R2LES7_9LACO|nr:NADPH-dependent oxidoreductase [Furfurilactobacillus siliginis]KRN97053.1 NADPH-dependent FMN reductase domain protein [Furfurilactobacillus siliginis]GEK27814.1 FMN reductase [Furfurilactobacillus siliginis]